MPVYYYKAWDLVGNSHEGELAAADVEKVKATLRARGLFIREVTDRQRPSSLGGWLKRVMGAGDRGST